MNAGTRCTALVAGAAVALSGLTGCGSDDPAVCTSVAELRSSIGNVEDVQLGENGLVELQGVLQQVQADAEQVASDAGEEYGAQLTTVAEALDALVQDARVAKEDPSATTIGALSTSVGAVATGVSSLQEAVSGTC